MKLLILVPDGVGVRNYLFSSFVNNIIKESNEVIIYHKLSNSAINEVKKNLPQLNNYIEIPNFIENPKIRLLRESLAFARLLRNKRKLENKAILKFWNPNKKGFKKNILYYFAEVLGYIMSKSYSLVLYGDKVFEKAVSKNIVTKTIIEELASLKPDFVLNLHQRSPITSPIISAANKLKIKTSTVIYSWDNVPKARLISRYNFYFVWSKLMKNELELLYPEIAPQQVKITGTPQFEFYFDEKYKQNKTAFFNDFGLDENRKTICFSGNDLSSPYEADYLRDICQEISKINGKDRPQLIFRRCPVDKSDRFNSVIEEFSDIIYLIDPDWKIEKEIEDSFVSIYPTPNDNKLLINTVNYSDLVINLGSTMAHDFAVLDKPCFYLNYNPVNNSTYRVEDIFEFQHFKSMSNLEAVGWLNSKVEIKEKIIKALEFPKEIGKDRVAWLQKIVLHPLANNSEVLKNTILDCL